jgi:hypothetical protein
MTAAIAAAALVGLAQVAARLVEFGVLRIVHPLVSARLAALLHPIGAVILGLVGPGAITAALNVGRHCAVAAEQSVAAEHRSGRGKSPPPGDLRDHRSSPTSGALAEG